MRKCVITGITGFIAHNVLEYFLEKTSWNFIGIDRIDETSTLERLKYIHNWEKHRQRVKFIWHDLKAPINKFLAEEIGQPDYILHFAASTHVNRSILDSMSFVNDNVIATVNLLNFAKDHCEQLLRFYYQNTDECWGPAKIGEEFKETDRHLPSNPYSASKSCGYQMCYSYYNTYKIPIISSNLMNVFGDRQNLEKFVPLVIKKILDQEEILLHASNDGQIGSRFYIHTYEVASAVDLILQKCPLGESVNIVGQEEIDNLSMVKKIEKIINTNSHQHEYHIAKYKIVSYDANRIGHDLRYALRPGKLLNMGFKFENSLDYYLEKTVKWYLDNPQWLKG